MIFFHSRSIISIHSLLDFWTLMASENGKLSMCLKSGNVFLKKNHVTMFV